MFNAFREGLRRVLTGEADVGSVDRERLWVGMVRQMISCMKNGGFYYEIEETPPLFRDVMFGVHCEVAVKDERGDSYEVGLGKFHWPGDRGESQVLQVSRKGHGSHTYVTVRFRSDVNVIRLSPDFMVKKSRRVSSYPRKLDFREELDLLSRLGRVVVDGERTLELFGERRKRDGRSVGWIRDMPMLSVILG